MRSQLGRECNIHFLKGWVSALEKAAVDDNSELYVLGREYQPFNLGTPENLEEVIAEDLKVFEVVEDPMGPEAVEVSRHQKQVQTEDVQDVKKSAFDKEDNANIDDDNAADSLKSQLKDKCDKYFVRGWRVALDRAEVDDASELYVLRPKCRPFRPVSPGVNDDGGAAEGPMDHEEEGAAEGLKDHEAGDG